MGVSERIKLVRSDLNLSQGAFGLPLGVSRDVINNLEHGRAESKESMIRLICKTYNVNYFWLTEGLGDMYIGPPDILLNDVVEKYNLDGLDRAIVEEYVKLDPEMRQAIKRLIENIIKNRGNNPAKL